MPRTLPLVLAAALVGIRPARADGAGARLCGGLYLTCGAPAAAAPATPRPALLGLPSAPLPGASSPVARWSAEQLASLADAPRPVVEAAAEALIDAGRPADARRLIEALAQGATAAQNCVYEALLLAADHREGKLARASQLLPRVREQLRRLDGAPTERCAVASLEAAAAAAAELHAKDLAADREALGEIYDALLPAARPGLAFARLPERLWPTAPALAFARGAVAWSQQAWGDCGHAFALVDARGAEGPAAVAFAGRCFARRIDEATPPLAARGDFLAPGGSPFRPLLPWEAEARDALDRAACASPDRPPLRRAAARLLLSAGHAGEAAAELRAAVESAAPADRAEPALLLLEAMGRAAVDDDDCLDEAERVRADVAREACAGRSPRPACATLDRFDAAIARAQAASLRRRAESAAAPSELHERAGRLLFDAARRCALDPADRPPSCERPEELIWAAAEAFAAARLPLKSIRARMALLDPRNRLLRTDQARMSFMAIARSYEAIADFASAADWFERFVVDYPGHPDTALALERSVQLRLVLDQEPEAARGAEILRTPPYRAHTARAVAAALSVVKFHTRRGSWDAASRRLDEAWRFLLDHGAPADRVAALALRGSIRQALRQRADADFRAALDLWARSGKPADEATLDAVAEAQLFELDAALARASQPPAPALSGRPSQQAQLRHLAGPVASWLTARRAQVEAFEASVDAFSKHDPALAPRWVAAAHERAFLAWRALERDASSPRWTGLPALLPALQKPIDDLLEPTRERTTSAAWACLRGAIQAASVDDSTLSCERWLASHASYRPVDESLLPRAVWQGTPPSDRPAPMLEPRPGP